MFKQLFAAKTVSRTLRRMAGILLATVALTATLSGCSDYQARQLEQTTVGKCANYNIPYEELRYVANHYRDYLESKYGEGIWNTETPDPAHVEELETLVIRNLNSTYAVYALCESLDVATESKDIDTYVNQKMNELKENSFNGNSKEFKAWLKENHMTENLLRQTLKSAYLESQCLDAMILSGTYVQYSTGNLSEFLDFVEHSSDYARTLHVFLQNEAGKDAPTTKQMNRAQEIRDALRAEVVFSDRFQLLCDFIMTDSNDYQMTSTNGYYFTKGEMQEDYETATFAMAIGDVSDPVVTADGVYIIMRLQPQSDYIMDNHTTLLQNYHGAVLGQVIETFREQYTAELNEYGKSLTLWDLE